MLESFRKHFLNNFFISKRFDAGKILFILEKWISRNVSWLTELNSQRDASESVRNVYLQGKVCRDATRRAVGESRAEVFSLKKNKPSHSFLSGLHVFPCCFSPLGE